MLIIFKNYFFSGISCTYFIWSIFFFDVRLVRFKKYNRVLVFFSLYSWHINADFYCFFMKTDRSSDKKLSIFIFPSIWQLLHYMFNEILKMTVLTVSMLKSSVYVTSHNINLYFFQCVLIENTFGRRNDRFWHFFYCRTRRFLTTLSNHAKNKNWLK